MRHAPGTHRFKIILGLMVSALVLSACSATSAPQRTASTRVPDVPVGEGVLKLPTLPVRSVLRFEEGVASWYGPGFDGAMTANGEIYDQDKFTAAHKSWAFGALVRVTRSDTGQSTIVRINDRGPYVEGRVIDLSAAAADVLGMMEDGIIPVTLENLGHADPVDRAATPIFFNPGDGPPRFPSHEENELGVGQ